MDTYNKQVEDIEPLTTNVHTKEVKVEKVTAPSGEATDASQQVGESSNSLLALGSSSQVDFG